MTGGAQGSQCKQMLPALESQEAEQPKSVLGTELSSSSRAADVLNC